MSGPIYGGENASPGNSVTTTSKNNKVYLDVSADLTATDINVDSTSVDTSGYIGKASGTNGDFVTAYASATTITLSSLPSGVSSITADDIVSVVQVATDGSVTKTYSRDDATMSTTGTDPTTLTIAGATFAASDTFVVYTNIAKPGSGLSYDSSTQSDRVAEINPLSDHYVNESLVDTTNVSATTHHYPSATGGVMDGYADLSCTGKFIDADGTLTLTLEVTNDEDTSGDWNGAYFYDDELNATVNNKTVTNGTELFSLSVNNNNFRRYRWAVVASGATNTVILKQRKKAL